ncbi:MAG: Fe3+/spermidine/putrescine transporter ATP-binding protein [Frankiales bacterium]|nr:Fe3+/spermidine/putrescine transporter ATP-binding protein [Frankiales bacterium]
MLSVRGLSVPPVLSAVDLDLSDGELVVVTGDDGAGTSTLLRALAAAWGDRARLLEQPPGTEWSEHDVAGDLADPALFAALGMTSPPDREMWMLSGGERQRVRLARVLAAPPEVALLLDEPLGYLDLLGRRRVLERLRGRTAVVVVKSDPDAELVADRVLVLADGRLSQT